MTSITDPCFTCMLLTVDIDGRTEDEFEEVQLSDPYREYDVSPDELLVTHKVYFDITFGGHPSARVNEYKLHIPGNTILLYTLYNNTARNVIIFNVLRRPTDVN